MGNIMVKILVSVKRVVDFNVKVRAKSDGSGVDIANVKMSINPFDAIAVEQAVRLKEASVATEIVAVSLGVKQCQETLRVALAMGADRAILVETNAELQPLAVAKLLKAVVAKESPISSSWASRPLTTTAIRPGRCWRRCLTGRKPHSRRKSRSRDGRAVVIREIDGGLEILSMKLPALITTDLRLNEPRYATLPNIMKAKKKPLETLSPEVLGVDVTPRLITVTVQEPPKRKSGEIVVGVAQLVNKLRNEAKVI